MTNLLDERDKRTAYRKLRKKKFDEMIKLSASDDTVQVRLLDEGTIVTATGAPDFYIEKGTLEKYYNSLDPDYVGSVNLGHMDFAMFPFLLGEWTKDDITLVDIGGGRKGLDVTLHLYDSVFVDELKKAAYDVGVSAEFTYSLDENGTDEFNLPMINELFISDLAIVGECGNVGSSGVKLKGDNMFKKKEEVINLSSEESVEAQDVVSENDEAQDIVSEAVEDDIPDEEESVEEQVLETIETLQAQLLELQDKYDALLTENEELRKEKNELSATLSEQVKTLTARVDEEVANRKEFVEKFKSLTVKLSPNLAEDGVKDVEPKSRYISGDGIGV